MSDKTESSLKDGLAKWAIQNNVRPVDFARAMGYTQAYGWSLLRGQANATVNILGRFVRAYGTQAVEELLALAGLPNPTVTTLPYTDAGVKEVPVVNVHGNGIETSELQPVV